MTSRRTSLGPISSSAMNSRMSMGRPSLGPSSASQGQSLGASRVSVGHNDGHPIKPPRMSLSNNIPAGRRSSIGGGVATARKSSITGRMSSIGTSSARLMNDPRNINDKAFMQTSLKQLIAYLSDHGFDHPISLKILTRPAVKDFSNIITFLFRQIDANFTSTGKFEDDVVMMMKQLGYPYQISKSHITAVGSPHAWPSLLGAIMWLIELLSYDDAAMIGSYIDHYDHHDDDHHHHDDQHDDDHSVSIKAFYHYLAHAYKLFLSGDDDQYNLLEQQFISSYNHNNMMIEDHISSLELSISSLEREIHDMEAYRSTLHELQTKKQDYVDDMMKFEHHIDTLVHHKDQINHKVEVRKQELNKLLDAIDIITQENQALHHRISCQEMTIEDVHHMMKEKERLEEAQYHASEIRQGLQRKVWEVETSLRDKVNALEDSARAYNSIAEDLKLVPSTAKNAHNKHLSIDIDIKTKNRSNIIKNNIQDDIIPILKEFIQSVKDETSSYHEVLIQQQDVYDDMEMKYHDQISSKSSYEAKLKRVDDAYKRDKDALDHALHMHHQEMDIMEAKLIKIRDTSYDDNRYHMMMNKISEMKSYRDHHHAEYMMMKKMMIDAIMEVVTLSANHHEYAQSCIHEVKDHYVNNLEKLLSSSSSASSSSYKDVTVRPVVTSSSYDGMSMMNDGLSPIHMHNDENARDASSFVNRDHQHQHVYSFAGLLNEVAKHDHNLLDDSIQIDFRDT